MASFFDRLVYSSPNEDGQIEAQTLGLTTDTRVLCITGCGARPLDLLTARTVPAEVVSIDFNPAQNHLLALTMAGFGELAHEELLAFLGIRPQSDRTGTYARLRPQLTPDCRAFWDRHPACLQDGILTAGRWHRYLTGMASLTLFRRRLLHQLFDAPDIETQARLWHERWDNLLWQRTIRILGNQWFWRNIMREPGALLCPPSVAPGLYLLGCFRRFVQTRLLRDSFLAHLLFFGRFDEQALPPYLQARHYAAIGENRHRIRPVTASLAQWLATTPDRFGAFSLSDVASYASPADYAAIWQGLLRTALPEARLAERQFLVKPPVPTWAVTRFGRDEAAEAWALQTDMSLIYSFTIGTFHAEGAAAG